MGLQQGIGIGFRPYNIYIQYISILNFNIKGPVSGFVGMTPLLTLESRIDRKHYTGANLTFSFQIQVLLIEFQLNTEYKWECKFQKPPVMLTAKKLTPLQSANGISILNFGLEFQFQILITNSNS